MNKYNRVISELELIDTLLAEASQRLWSLRETCVDANEFTNKFWDKLVKLEKSVYEASCVTDELVRT